MQQENALDQIKHIRAMMEKSSRFISLSGWSGICAGISALVGAYVAHLKIQSYYQHDYGHVSTNPSALFNYLIGLACIVFILAAISAVFFTYLKSKQNNIPLWGEISRRLLWNTCLPVAIGGIFILKLIQDNSYDYVSACCLIFYGLGLINGSKYTLGEVKYLGYAQVILGIINLYFVKHGLIFWAIGFGIFHIIYGITFGIRSNEFDFGKKKI